MNMPVPRRQRPAQFFESSGEGGPDAWVPAVETDETDDAYLVRAELPGMKRDDVDIELRGNELRITGEVKEEEKEEGEGKPLRRRYGKFAYRTSLPADADAEKIDAQLTDGILTVRLPKAAQARSRRIEIQS
jgi:HSP20 family protein